MINKSVAGALYQEPDHKIIQRDHNRVFEQTCKPEFINAGLPLPIVDYLTEKQCRVVDHLNAIIPACLENKLEGVTEEDIIQLSDDLLGMAYANRVWVALERIKRNDASFSLQEAL